MSVKIIVDSTTDITDEIRNEVTVVPLTIRFGDEEYEDGVTITHEEFYEKLASSPQIPTTSQVSPAKFTEVFKEATEDGSTAVVITISGKLSGTYQSAMIAANDFPDKVFVVDSKTITIAAGVLTQLALKLRDEGFSAKEIAEKLKKERENVVLFALFDTLKYLKKGGRISHITALAGTLLSIKPVITVKDGEAVILNKARGRKQGYSIINSEIDKCNGMDKDMPYLLGYTGSSSDNLDIFVETVEELSHFTDSKEKRTIVGSVVGTHAGPDAVAVAFFKNKA